MNRQMRRQWARAQRSGAQALGHMGGLSILPIDAGAAVVSSLKVRAAYEALRDGQGDDDDFHTLAGALNVALVRAEQIHELAEVAVIQAQQALMLCLARRERGLRYGFDHTGLEHIPPALDIYDDILAGSTPAQMQEALQEAARRMQAGQVMQTNQPHPTSL